LRYLNLNYTEIGTDGLEHLCNGFLVNTSLREVHLDGCKISDRGGLQLAACLQVNSSIMTLRLANNELEADSIIAMATILHGNNTLRVLDFSRPLLFSHLEETTRHFSNAMKVS